MTAGRAKGCFLALEGVDGAGKTGAAKALAAALQQAGCAVLPTREPGGTPEGLALRGLLLAEAGHGWEPGAELLLMTAARIQHVRRVIAPAVAAGTVVLCDRFVGSTLAYQGAGRGLPSELILGLHRDLVGDLWPDLTILLDIDPARSLERARARQAASATDEGKFESLDLAFHRRVRESFLEQARRRPRTTLVIDAARDEAAVQADVAAQVLTRLGTL
jgi:dTMP kinase